MRLVLVLGEWFQNRSSAQIIGINEVLKALVSAGALDKNGYYEKIGIAVFLKICNKRYCFLLVGSIL